MQKLLAILFCLVLLTACTTRPKIDFPETPAGQTLKTAYLGHGQARAEALRKLYRLDDESRKSLSPALDVIIRQDVRKRNWPLVTLEANWPSNPLKGSKTEIADKFRAWLPYVIANVGNANPEDITNDTFAVEPTPGVLAAFMLFYYEPDQLRPHTDKLAARFNAPVRGEIVGESLESWHRHMLAEALIAVNADAVRGLARALDHPNTFVRDEAFAALAALTQDPIDRLDSDIPENFPLAQPRTAQQQADILRALRPHFPRFVQALETETEDAILRDAVTIIESIAEPALVTPRLLTALSKIEARSSPNEFYTNAVSDCPSLPNNRPHHLDR